MKTNYHAHTTFCDGKNSPREMAEEAITRGFNIFGISAHCMYPFSSEWHIPIKDINAYLLEMKNLKKEFSSKIELQTGFEADYICGMSIPSMNTYKQFSPDYLIGAVHYIVNEKGQFTVDGPIEEVKNGIHSFLSGNGEEAVHLYFQAQRELLEKGDFHILAHPDLIRKLNPKLNFFDETDSYYKQEIALTAKAIAKSGVMVEINTGGMARGYLDEPYPSNEFLKLLKENNVPVTINSDAHETNKIDFAFEKAQANAKKAGYKEIAYIQDGNIKFYPL